MKSQILQKISQKTARIGVVGLGYVGLPLVLRYVEAGFNVTGLDIDPRKVDAINRGKSYINHIGPERVREAASAGKLRATTDFSEAAQVDAIILCVPTPLGKNQEPDLSFIRSTVQSLAPHLRADQILSLESTTYPGTTDEEILPMLREKGFRIGEDYFVVFSPEREDPGNERFHTRTIPKVVGGTTVACLEVGCALYGAAVDRVVPVSSTKAAEMVKLLENIFRAINISLVNELKIISDKMGIDIWEVIEAAATKPFGFTPFYPGPGMGGHCIPVDPFYLTWKSREFGIHTRFIELAGEINSGMPNWIVSKLADALNDRGRSIKHSKILVLGLAYKKNIDDVRESPAMEIMSILREKGAELSYSDPHVAAFPPMRRHNFKLESQALTPQMLKSADAVLIATDHDAFDYELIAEHAKLILDARGRFRKSMPNLVRC